MTSGRTLIIVTFVLGLIALFATRCAAQAPDPAPAGSLVAETIAATSTALAVGALSIGWALHEHGNNGDALGEGVVVYLVAGPLLTTFATMIAGDATGGDGSALKTLGASAGGTYLVTMVSMTVLPLAFLMIYGFDDEDESNDDAQDRAATIFLLSAGALALAATSVGAIIGYRSSSRSRARHALFPAPTADLRGMSLTIVGQF